MSLETTVATFHVAMHKIDEAKAMAEKSLSTLIDSVGSIVSFKDENGWLSDDGKKALRMFYDAGMTGQKAAEILEISPPGAYRYITKWNKEKRGE